MNIQDVADTFYETKGDFTGWSDADKKRWMSAMLDVSALLTVPDSATRQEWILAKDTYRDVYDIIEAQVGEGIWDLVNESYAIQSEDYQYWRGWMERNPEVQEAKDLKNAAVAGNPDLYRYYGSLETIDNYYRTELNKEMAVKHGDDIAMISAHYSDMVLPEQKKLWRKDNPKEYKRLKKYWDDLYDDANQNRVNEAVIRLGNHMPDAYELNLREGATSDAQQAIVDAITPPDHSEMLSQLRPEHFGIIRDYMETGELDYSAEKALDKVGDFYGLNANDIIQIVTTQ